MLRIFARTSPSPLRFEIKDPLENTISWRQVLPTEEEFQTQEYKTYPEAILSYKQHIQTWLDDGCTEHIDLPTDNAPYAQHPPEPSADLQQHTVWWDDAKTFKKSTYHTRGHQNDPKEGPSESWHRNGQIMASYEYRNDEIYNVFGLFDQEGKELPHGTLQNGNGLLLEYHDNDQIRAIGSYQNGLAQGVWNFFHTNGALSSRGEFLHNKKEGTWLHWHNNYTFKTREVYHGPKISQIAVFNANGVLHCIGEGAQLQPDGPSLREGLWTFYNEKAQRFRTEQYTQPNFLRTEYDPVQGHIKAKQNYTQGRSQPILHGTQELYAANGDLLERKQYDLGGFVTANNDEAPQQIANILQENANLPTKDLRHKVLTALKFKPAHLLPVLAEVHQSGTPVPPAVATGTFMHLHDEHPKNIPALFKLFPKKEALQAIHDLRAELDLEVQSGGYVPPHANLCIVFAWWTVDPTSFVAEAGELLAKACADHSDVYGHRKELAKTLHDILTQVPEDMREDAVFQYNRPLWHYVSTLSTHEVFKKALTHVPHWTKTEFSYAAYRQESIRKTLNAWGGKAAKAAAEILEEENGYKAPKRALLAELVAKGATPELLPVLLKLAADKQEESSTWAARGLANLYQENPEELLVHLKARKKNLRITAAKAITFLHPPEKARQLASSPPPKTKDDALAIFSAFLEQKSDASQEPAELVALLESITEEETNALFARLERIAERGRSVPLGELSHRDIRNAVAFVQRTISQLERQEKTILYSFASAVRAYRTIDDHPLTPWLAAKHAVRALQSKYDIQANCRDLTKLLGDEFIRALSFYLAQENPSRAIFVGWIAEHHPKAGRRALLLGLGDKSKSLRTRCVAAIRNLEDPSDLFPELRKLLAGSTAEITSAAEILESNPDADAIPALEEALKKARGNAKGAVESALVVAQDRFQSPSNTDATQENPQENPYEALETSLNKRKPRRPPKLNNPITVRWLDGTPLSEGALHWILATLKKEDAKTHNAELQTIAKNLLPEDKTSLAAEIMRTFPANAKNKWVRYQLAHLGDRSLIDKLGAGLQDDVRRFSSAWASHGVNVLLRSKTPTAFWWLDHWSRNAETNALLRDTKAGAQAKAQEANLHQDEMAHRSVETCGLNPQRSLTRGGQTWTLSPQGALLDSKGQTIRLNNLSPEEKAFATDLQEQILHARNRATTRLELAMLTHHRWSAENWSQHILQHPIYASLLPNVLVLAHTHKGPLYIRYKDAITPTNPQGYPVDLPKQTSFSIPHPVDMPSTDLHAWSSVLTQQPFSQLDRFFHPQPIQEIDNLLKQHSTLATRSLQKGANNRQYRTTAPEDAGIVYGYTRKIGSEWELAIEHDGYYAGDGRNPNGKTNTVHDACVSPTHSKTPMPLYCELLLDLRHILL